MPPAGRAPETVSRSRVSSISMARPLSVQSCDPERFAEAAACFKWVAVFAMRCGLLGTGKQQAAAIGAAALPKILKHALSDLLVMGIVAEPRRGQGKTFDQRIG